MTELNKKRLRQLNVAVYHHLLSYSTELGNLFKIEAEKANVRSVCVQSYNNISC
jgi:hypothetical protein